MLLCYVDHLLLSTNDATRSKPIFNNIFTTFELKNLGFTDKSVGIIVEKLETGRISLDFENYINETIKVVGMQNANEAGTPLAADTVLEKETNPKILMETPTTGQGLENHTSQTTHADRPLQPQQTF